MQRLYFRPLDINNELHGIPVANTFYSRLFQFFSRVIIKSQPKVPGGFLPNAAKENVTVKAIGFLSH